MKLITMHISVQHKDKTKRNGKTVIEDLSKSKIVSNWLKWNLIITHNNTMKKL